MNISEQHDLSQVSPQPEQPVVVESAAAESTTESAAPHTVCDCCSPLACVGMLVAGATLASVGGLAAVVLSILGLSDVSPVHLAPTAGIVIGLALATLGAVGATWARLFTCCESEHSRSRMIFHGSVVTTAVAGLVAIVLGILNFAFLGDVRFVGVAVIAAGVGLMVHSGVMRRVSGRTHAVCYPDQRLRPTGPFAVNALSVAAPRDFLMGLVAVVLGVLAMMHVAPLTLEFIALLVLGVAVTTTATAICGAALAAFHDAATAA